MKDDRYQSLNDKPVNCDGDYVLYWMQSSQRSSWNPALEHGIRCANELGRPLVVGFGLDSEYPDANARHFAFMLEGLAETAENLYARGIAFVTRLGKPEKGIADLSSAAAMVVCDRGYLRHHRASRSAVASKAGCSVVQVEGDVVVPVETASDQREWAARTIRKKINGHRDGFIHRLSDAELAVPSLRKAPPGDVDVRHWRKALRGLDIDRRVAPVGRFKPGTKAARENLTQFLRRDLPGWAENRNDPSSPCASELSPYLHFGQISPVEIAYKVHRSTGASEEDKEAFLEQLIVRRELACNFVYFTRDYDRFAALPDWARKTLIDHKEDARPVSYTRRQLEAAETDDVYWNAAMQELRKTGYMHNYMRMYWGKKIIEWSNTPEYAYATALYLNNRYFLDGRDPNSYASVGWLFGLHDQAWSERAIFGKVRFMNARGLQSKFDIDAYVARINAL